MANKRIRKHLIIRWSIQISFLFLFILFFIQIRYGVTTNFQNIFFRFDPLIFIITSIAIRTIISASLLSLFLIVATIIFGRFFCGFVCPLGTILDLCDPLISNNKTKSVVKNGKYLILLFLVISALIGTSFLHFFDPLAIFERSLTLIFLPIVTYFIGPFTNSKVIVYTETIIGFMIFMAIIGLEFIAPRFWCRNLCPLGGIFAFLSKFSLFKFSFSKNCTQCGFCEEICPTAAINFAAEKVDSAECIDCLRCQYECPTKTIEYKINFTTTPFDVKRRQFIAALGAGIVLAPLARSLIHQKLSGQLIRPPGSIPEPDFLNVCVRCSNCLKVCPTNGLQPCIFEAGLNGLWTPRLVSRIGGCEKNCNMCGKVCPTSAIRNLSLEEKTYVIIGTAVIDRSRCIAWEQDKVCLICDEACPYNAINSLNETIHSTTLLRPFVNEKICTGCGLCESVCPIHGRAAVEIFSMGEERKTTGSYVTEEKKRQRSCRQNKDDIPSGFILDSN